MKQNKAKEPAYGADVLRFWAASAGYTKDVTCSLDTIAGSAEMLRKIRNTIRFILGNLRHGIDASQTSYNLNFVCLLYLTTEHSPCVLIDVMVASG